jgi:uncharacterized protein YbjQ (UPF0145 family)
MFKRPSGNEDDERSRARLAARGLPPEAERRTERQPEGGGVFVSTLNAREFALVASDDVAPLGVVTGSSVYHVGWQWTPLYESRELASVTQAERQVRMRALSRLQQEAARMDAHGVIDVRFGKRDLGREVLEFTATGTAIRLTQGQPPPRPFLCTLSAGEFWTLRRAGYRPCGVALGVCAFYHVASIPLRNLRYSRREGQIGRRQMSGMEYAEYSEAIQFVRRTTMDRLESEARQGLAEGVIGLRLDQSIGPPPPDDNQNKYRRYDLMIRFTALGTAITPHRDRWPLLDYAVPLDC